MWEYDRFEVKYESPNQLVKQLNEFGKENWEIISYNEIEPKKFGDNKLIIIVKRLKPA